MLNGLTASACSAWLRAAAKSCRALASAPSPIAAAALPAGRSWVDRSSAPCLTVVGGVAAHPGLLDVGRAQRGPGPGVAGHPAQPVLGLRDGGGEPVRHRLRGPGRRVRLASSRPAATAAASSSAASAATSAAAGPARDGRGSRAVAVEGMTVRAPPRGGGQRCPVSAPGALVAAAGRGPVRPTTAATAAEPTPPLPGEDHRTGPAGQPTARSLVQLLLAAAGCTATSVVSASLCRRCRRTAGATAAHRRCPRSPAWPAAPPASAAVTLLGSATYGNCGQNRRRWRPPCRRRPARRPACRSGRHPRRPGARCRRRRRRAGGRSGSPAGPGEHAEPVRVAAVGLDRGFSRSISEGWNWSLSALTWLFRSAWIGGEPSASAPLRDAGQEDLDQVVARARRRRHAVDRLDQLGQLGVGHPGDDLGIVASLSGSAR